MIAYINDEYEDDTGQILPIDPKIPELCEKYNLSSKESASFKNVPGGTDNFEAWAFKHHVTGNHVLQFVNEKRYLDLYMMQQELPETSTNTTTESEVNETEPETDSSDDSDDFDEENFEEDTSNQGLVNVDDFPDPLAGDEQAMTESVTAKNPQKEEIDLPDGGNTRTELPEDESEPNYETVVQDVDLDDNDFTFDAKAFFDELPEPQQVGVLNVTNKLKKTNDHSIKIDDVSSEMMRASLRHLIHDPLVDQLVYTIGYSELCMSYMMYMATATQQIKQTYWKQWCVAKIVARIVNAASARKNFEAHHSIRDIIEDDKSETKVTDGVRWFMLLSTIRPQADVVSTESRTDRKLDQLQNEIWLVNALSTAMLASEDIDPEDWPELLVGQRAKSLRTKITQLRNDLVKPYKTIKRTEAARRRGK